MAENFQKAIEDLTLEEAQAEIRRAWDMWREMDDLHDQACDWAIAANSLRDALQARVEEAERAVDTLLRERNEAQALAERRKRALRPFAEVYGRSSKLIHETRGMSSVPLRHRVVLLSEQSDGSFGYLAIKVFRDARAAIEEEAP